jgi:ATP-dependent helicase/nuclease subunit A
LRATVDALWRNLDRLGPGGVLREAVRALALEEVLVLLSRGEQRVANVRKLLRLADRETSAVRFLERLEEKIERAVAESEAAPFSDEDDAVRLLTVHASKGLDFPIVFVPQIAARSVTRGLGAIAIDLGCAGASPAIAVKVFDPEIGPLEGPAYARVREEAARRDRAERQRLSYVAMTRASHAVYLVGDATPPKKESPAHAATDAAALRALGPHPALLTLDVAPRVPEVWSSASRAAEPPPAPVDPRLTRPAWKALAIAPTALQDFAHCKRRFQLMHVLGLPERAAPAFAVAAPREDDDSGPRLDARAEGTLAHRVLERLPRAVFGAPEAAGAASEVLAKEGLAVDHPRHAAVVTRVARFVGGAYAARVARAGAELAREAPFVLCLSDPEGRTLALRGSIDLLVTWPDGSVDVVDYKRARGPSAEPYAFQLDVYALAARELAPGAPRLRAGIVFLGGDPSEPAWRRPPDPARMSSRLAELAADLVRARWTETFPRVAPDRCRAIRCGYFRACHPGEQA